MHILGMIGKLGLSALQVFFGIPVSALAGGQPLISAIAAPAVSTLASAGDLLKRFIALVGDIERIGEIVKKSGGKLDKLQEILPSVQDAIKNSELLAGKEVIDEALFTSAAQCYAEGTVRLLKSIKQKGT